MSEGSKLLFIDDLMAILKDNMCKQSDLILIKDAYNFAERKHSGQSRLSGEEYIQHPLAVAFILSEIYIQAGIIPDANAIAASLLHDLIEDCSVSKAQLEILFNSDIAELVDGVSEISRMNFSTKDESIAFNQLKVLKAAKEDIRIILIKLSDRLHNMRTQYAMPEINQKSKSHETFEIYAPFAWHLGLYGMKNELEDLSLRYSKPEAYCEIKDKLVKISESFNKTKQEMLVTINRLLSEKGIAPEVQTRVKNIYGIYKSILEGKNINDIYDLFAIKIVVDTIDDCYLTLGAIHSEYNPVFSSFKDYISIPKDNLYQSLHTTVLSSDNKFVQMQIRTHGMDMLANYGIVRYLESIKDKGSKYVQDEICRKFQVFRSLVKFYDDNQHSETRTPAELIGQIKKDILSARITVVTPKGERISLPVGSTPIDFAYELNPELGNTIEAAIVNGQYTDFKTTVLKDNDIVMIIGNECSFGPKKDWLQCATTETAKTHIRKFFNKIEKGES